MPGEHARLSPSAAERWMQCPGSVRLSDQVVRNLGPALETTYAREGTHAHKIAALMAARAFDQITEEQYQEDLLHWHHTGQDYDRYEMVRHAGAYVDLLVSFASEHPHTKVMLEQRVNTGVPGCWGTADASLVAPTHIHVVDYKYGMGISVSAEENPQLMLYGVGALDTFDLLGNIETVCVTIHQPRLDDISHYCLSAKELRAWRDNVVLPVAALALGPDGYLSPSEAACRFCPAAGDCRTRSDWVARRDFGNPDLLSVEEVSQLLHDIPAIEDWCKAVKENALHQAYNNGVEIPGWKVVRSGGKRSIPDQELAIKVLQKAKFGPTKTTRRSLKTLGDLERLVGGRSRLHEILGDLIRKAEGKEALVPESDDRSAITAASDAARDFSHED